MKRETLSQDDFAQDAQEEIPSDSGLREVARLADRQVALEDELEELESQIKAKKALLAQVKADYLPAAMAELGLETFTLTDGSSISIKEVVSAHISQDNKEKAHLWLAEHGHGDIVKNQVVLTFGKQEDEIASEATNLLKQAGYHPDRKQSVHGQTLKAWVRERLRQGEVFPTELFGVYVGNESKITRTKK